MDKLLDFRGIVNSANGILTATDGLADVCIKCCLDFRVRFILRDFAGLELGIAALADSDGREGWLHDPEFALLHTVRITQTFFSRLSVLVALQQLG